MNERGFIQLSMMAYGALAAGVVILALSGAVWVQTERLDSVKTEYAQFSAGVKAVGEVALKAKVKQEATDKKRKEVADENHNRTIAGLESELALLHDERTRGGGLSSASTPAPGTDRTSFDPALLAGALRRLDTGSVEIIGAGQKAVIDLDAAKGWAQGQ